MDAELTVVQGSICWTSNVPDPDEALGEYDGSHGLRTRARDSELALCMDAHGFDVLPSAAWPLNQNRQVLQTKKQAL